MGTYWAHCDVMSHAVSEYVEGGQLMLGRDSGQCPRLVPALACVAGSCPAGCGAQGKARGSPFRPGATGEGKAGRGERQ